MFGLIFIFTSLFVAGLSYIMREAENKTLRIKAREKGNITYFDSNGKQRLVSNNKWVSESYNDNHEKVISDMLTGEIYHNLTRDKKRKVEKTYINKGKTIRPKMLNEKNKLYGKYHLSYSNIDIATNIPVREIEVNGIYFYMSLDNGHLLRTVDNANLKNKVGNYKENEIIKIFNTRQDIIINSLEEHKNEPKWLQDNFFFSDGYRSYFIYIDRNQNINIFNNYERLSYLRCVENDK